MPFSALIRNETGVLDRLTHPDAFNTSNRRLTLAGTGSLSVPLLLVAPPSISLNGYVLVILYVLSAFSAVTRILRPDRSKSDETVVT